MNKQNNQNIQGRTGTRTDQQILEKHTGVQEKVRGYMKRGKLRRIIAILSAFVLLFTLNSLKFRADTLQRIAMCGLEEHTHTEACYNEAGELVCGRTEHEHTDACYQQRPVQQPEPTVFDEFKDLNSQVVLASPMEEGVSVSSDSVDETVGETTMDLDADSADEGIDAEAVTDEGGLEVEYDLDDLYGEDDDETTIVDDYVENDAADAGNDADQTVAEYSLNGGSVAFLSDVLRATGLEVSGITAVGEIADDAFVDTHIAVEPVEGVDGEYVLKVTESFDRVQLGVATADAIETVWLTDGQAVAAVYDEAQTSDETVVAEEAAEPAEPAEEIVEQTEETFNSNETIETEQKQTEVGEIETEVGMDADVSGDQDASSDEENRVEAEAAPIENDESVTEDAADASDVQGVEDAAGDNAVAENEDAADAAVGEDASSVEDEQVGEDAADAAVGEDASSVEDEQAGEDAADEQAGEDGMIEDGQAAGDEQAAVVADRKVSLDFTNYIVDDAHTVYLYDAEMRAVLVNTAEIETVDGVVVTAAEEEAANEAADEAAEDESGEESEETGADEGGVLIIEGDGEYALNGTAYVVTGLVLPEAVVEEAQGAEQSGEEIQDAEAPAEEAQADEETAVGDQSADDAQDEAAPAEKTVALDFTDYIATDDHAVFLYDASMVAVLVNEAEIASADGVTVTLPEEAAEETDEALADAEEDAEAPAEEAADDAQAGEGALIITGDGEYALNGTTYVVTGLVLPEKAVGNDNITIATTNDEATLLNVAPVFEETDEDYDDIFSLFTMAKDDPTLLARVMDILGGVAYAEEGEVGRDLNVKVFRIGLEDVTTGEAVEPGTELHVETSLEKPIEGEDFALYHIADGKAELIPDAVVVEDGQAVGLNFNTVSLDKFALVYYTVNVVVEEKNITIDVDFTDVVENGVDFDSQAILTALNDGVAIDVASLLAGETGDSLIVEASATADVDVENLEATAAEGGVTYADGAIKVTGDGAITLTDSVYTIIINVTNYQTLVEKELKADGVTVEVIDGEVPAGSTVTYEALSDAHTEALVEEYIPEAVPASAEAEPAPAEAKAAASGEEEADSASAEETVEEPQEAAEEAAEAPSDATDESVEEKSEEKIETATGYTAFDVSIAMPEGDEFTKEGQFAVTVDHAVDAASLVPEGAVIDNITYELFHIHNGEATQIEDVAVADGQVSFTTDGFSEYVIRYTVDFEVEGDQGEITLDFKAFDATTLPGEGEIYYDTEDCCIHVALGLLTGIINSEAEALYDIDVNANLVDHYEFDFDKAEMGKSDSGMRFADGELIIASDGFVELTEGERLLRVRATGLTALKQALLEAENVSIEVVSGNVPLGSEASYTAHTYEEIAELVENYINNEENGDSEVAGYSAADLKIVRNDETLPVEGQFKVTVDKASLVPVGMKLDKLYHIHRDENDEAVVEELAFEETEAGLVFELANFSDIVAGYTVDFEYNGYKWSFPGLGSYSIASIMEEIGVEGEITHVSLKLIEGEEVEGALYLEKKEDGWYLTSDCAFDETYELTVVVEGKAYGIMVTDAQSTLTTTITFFAQDAEIIGEDVDPDKPYMHIIGHTEAPTGLSSTYYVLAVLKNRQGNELGWAIQTIGQLTTATTQVSFSDFNPFETQGSESADEYSATKGQTIAPDTEKIHYDKDQNTISTRLYRADEPLDTLNYYELKTSSAQNQTYTTPEDGYEYGGNFTIQDGTVNEIHVKKANNKKYKVRIYLDKDAKDDIAESDNYYLYIDVTHQSGDHSYQYQRVSITAADTKNGYVEYVFPHWMDYNGNVKKATDDNNAFTGNETKIQVRLLNFENFKPNNINNATVNEEGSAIKAYQVHYDTREYGAESTPTGYYEELEEVDGKTIVNCIDKIELQTIDAEGKYTYASILGPNLPYGIVADHLFHVTHLQTNFAVNHYTGHGIDSRPDLSGKESGGAFVIAEYNYKVDDFWQNGVTNGVGAPVHENVDAGKLFVGQNLYGTVVAYVDKNSGAEGDLGNENAKVRGNLAQTVVVETEGYDLKNNIVDPALDYMDDMSRELASHEATFVPPIPSEDGKPIIIDTMAFPEGATIFIDADAFKEKIAKTSGVEIRKKPEQVIIFNFKEEVPKGQEISFGRFVVKQEGFPENGFATISPEDKGSDREANPDNALMDAVARHVVWNLYNVKGTANIVTSGGMFLQPNEDSQIIIKGTTAGWISTKGYVANDGGEWHNVYSEMPSMANLKLHAYKTIDNRQPRVSQKFNFFLDEYDTTVTGDWKNLDAKLNTTGSVDFNKISEGLTDGWHVYRIHEDTSKPAETMGYYIMDGDTYYAVVRVQTVTTAGNTPATVVSEPAYYRNFTPGSFHSDSDVLTGFSEEDKVQRAVFNNEQVTKGLNILKKVQGTAATDVDFKFKVELWYQDDEGIHSPYISEVANLSTEAAQFNAVTANGTDTFTLVENLDNHSVGYVTLKAGELVTIQGINEEAHYKITEIMVGEKSISTDAYVDGYKAKTGSKEGTMSDEGEGLATVTFENEYKAEGTLDLKAHKTLTDKTGQNKQLAANMFAFRLTGPNAVNPTEWIWNDANGNVTFPAINYSSADMEGAEPDPSNDNKLTKTLTYTVHEKHELSTGATGLAAQNVTYDDDKTVTVTLVDNGDGTITATADVADLTVEFNNTYEYQVPKGFEGTKVLTGRDMEDQEFWFNAVLTKYSDGTTETNYTNDTEREAVDFVSATKVEGTNRANGNILFPVITFKQAGSYTFTVTEDVSRLPDDVEPTTPGQSYDVIIVVTEDTDSTTGEKILVAGEPTYPNGKTINNTQKKMGFTVTKEWFNAEGTQVFDGHTITFSVTKDGEAFPVTDGHIEKVGTSSTDGSYTVNSDGTVTLTAGTEAWPTVRLKELVYPTTGYAVSETAHTGEADGNFVNTTYRLNAGDYQATSPAVKVNDDALKIKNNETSTGLHVTKKWVASDGETDIGRTIDEDTVYFKLYCSYNNSGNVGAVGDTIYQITKGADGKWSTFSFDELSTNPWNWNNFDGYYVVETDSEGNPLADQSSITYTMNGEEISQTNTFAADANGLLTITNKVKPTGIQVVKKWVGPKTDSVQVELRRMSNNSSDYTTHDPDKIKVELIWGGDQGTVMETRYYEANTTLGISYTNNNSGNVYLYSKKYNVYQYYAQYENDLPYQAFQNSVNVIVPNSPVRIYFGNEGNANYTYSDLEISDSSDSSSQPDEPMDKSNSELVTTNKNGDMITNPVTLSASNNWLYEWTNLDSGYLYFIKEQNTNGYVTTYTNNDGIKKGLITVTNTKTEEEKGALKITKLVWYNNKTTTGSEVDGDYIFKVVGPTGGTTVTKYVRITVVDGQANSYKVASANTDEAWSDATSESGSNAIVGNLTPGYYVVEELAPTNGSSLVSAARGDEIASAVDTNKKVTVVVSANDTTAVNNNAQAVFTNNKNGINITATKRWVAGDGVNLTLGTTPDALKLAEGDYVKFELYRQEGNDISTKVPIGTVVTVDGTVDQNSTSTGELQPWVYTWDKLDKMYYDRTANNGDGAWLDYTYSVKETEFKYKGVTYTIGTGGVVTSTETENPNYHPYWKCTVTPDGNNAVFTNDLNETHLDVNKKWWSLDGVHAYTGNLTGPITLTLYRIKTPITAGNTVTVNELTTFTLNGEVDSDVTTLKKDGSQVDFCGKAKETAAWAASFTELPLSGVEEVDGSNVEYTYAYYVTEAKADWFDNPVYTEADTNAFPTENERKNPSTQLTVTDANGKTVYIHNKETQTFKLPSTGGPGTSMFYVFGSIITLLAAVLLITKRRSGSAE